MNNFFFSFLVFCQFISWHLTRSNTFFLWLFFWVSPFLRRRKCGKNVEKITVQKGFFHLLQILMWENFEERLWVKQMGCYFRENPNRDGRGEDMEFPEGYWRNTIWLFQGLIKKEAEFLGYDQEKFMWNLHGCLVFGPEISKGCNTILQNFQGWSFVLSGISVLKITKLQTFFFPKNMCPRPLPPPGI